MKRRFDVQFENGAHLTQKVQEGGKKWNASHAMKRCNVMTMR